MFGFWGFFKLKEELLKYYLYKTVLKYIVSKAPYILQNAILFCISFNRENLFSIMYFSSQSSTVTFQLKCFLVLPADHTYGQQDRHTFYVCPETGRILQHCHFPLAGQTLYVIQSLIHIVRKEKHGKTETCIVLVLLL